MRKIALFLVILFCLILIGCAEKPPVKVRFINYSSCEVALYEDGVYVINIQAGKNYLHTLRAGACFAFLGIGGCASTWPPVCPVAGEPSVVLYDN